MEVRTLGVAVNSYRSVEEGGWWTGVCLIRTIVLLECKIEG
jgi:hypothetical protein